MCVSLGFPLRVKKVSTGIAANSQTQPLSGMQIQIDFTMSINTSQQRFLKNPGPFGRCDPVAAARDKSPGSCKTAHNHVSMVLKEDSVSEMGR